jgi:hypothetical protein
MVLTSEEEEYWVLTCTGQQKRICNGIKLGRRSDDTLRTFQVPELIFVQPSRMRKRG